LQRDEFRRKSLHRLCVERCPASVDPDVAALRPPELLESLAERRDVVLSFKIALGIRHQHADAPHPLTLLRPRCARPRRRRAAEEGDELTPLQLTKCIPWPRSARQQALHRHRRLLRQRGERQCSRRATKQLDELAPYCTLYHFGRSEPARIKCLRSYD